MNHLIQEIKQLHQKLKEIEDYPTTEMVEDMNRLLLDNDELYRENRILRKQLNDDFMKPDNRVQMDINFEDDELLEYMIMAHEMDITFNQFINHAITKLIEQSEK